MSTINDPNTLLKAALIHLEMSLRAGRDLSFLREYNIDPDKIDPKVIDQMVAILFKTGQHENYKTVALSTSHITPADSEILDALAFDNDNNMVMKRDTGHFIKLYEELESSTNMEGLSDSLKKVITWAHDNDYRMIELDSDAAVLEDLPTYDWDAEPAPR